MEKTRQRSLLERIVAMAVAFRPRFGMGSIGHVGDFTPTISGMYSGPDSIHGRVKHAGETRRIKKRQRHRAHMRSLRG